MIDPPSPQEHYLAIEPGIRCYSDLETFLGTLLSPPPQGTVLNLAAKQYAPHRPPGFPLKGFQGPGVVYSFGLPRLFHTGMLNQMAPGVSGIWHMPSEVLGRSLDDSGVIGPYFGGLAPQEKAISW